MATWTHMRIVLAFCAATLGFAQAPDPPVAVRPNPEDRRQIEAKAAELDSLLRPLRGVRSDELLCDAEVYLKAVRWMLRFEEFYAKSSAAQALAVLDTGIARARDIGARAEPSWVRRKGRLSRAYRSRVDSSVQPYGLVIPDSYDGSRPVRLDVVLHGRGATLTEVSFLAAHDAARPVPPQQDYITLEVYGRGNNAYRWAGETDVFEAVESVKKHYRIDADRIVLRGFSMGGAGAWHLGLHHPDVWAAVEAGAGFTETRVHARREGLPPYVHIYDAVDYALNAANVPLVGYGGEDDPQLRASVFVREALSREGFRFQPDGSNHKTSDLRALFLVGPRTQHRWHPESRKLSEAFLGPFITEGRREPERVRLVTWTERYGRCFWITVDQLAVQYERAEVDAKREGGAVTVATENVSRISVRGGPAVRSVTLDGKRFPVRGTGTFDRVKGSWMPAKPVLSGKRKGLQGPLDDAFMDSFVCVRPRDPASDADRFAQRQLDRFSAEFARWMRGDVRIRDTAEVSEQEVRTSNLIAFGDPWSNPWVARALRNAPVQWTRDSIVAGGRTFDARSHVLSMILPNPANPDRYLVINSGHTFHESDFQGTNALLYPRVGDWAVMLVPSGEVVAEGVFDRNWR